MKKTIPSKSTKKNEALFSLSDKTLSLSIRWLCVLLFVFTACYYTAIHNKNFLLKIQELSLFLPTKLFFYDSMKTAGGFLTYCGTFLTQFFYYPWLGSVIFILMLFLVQWLVFKTYQIPSRFFPITFIPSQALLLAFSELGYVIFTLKSPGYVYSNMLGVIVILCFLYAYRSISSWLTRGVLITLFVLAGYPLFGFYALFSAFLCVAFELFSFFRDKNKNILINIALTFLFIGLVPYIYYGYYYTQMRFEYIYIAALPAFYFTRAELVLWLPFIALFFSLLFYCVFLFRQPANKKISKSSILVFCIYLLGLWGVHHYSFEDKNFRTAIDIDLAISKNDWKQVAEIAARSTENPTRLIMMDTNLALQKLGLAGDKMFHYNKESVPFNSPRSNLLMLHLGVKALYFQYGKVNFCYRWCMEDMVEYGMKVEYLKYMVKCALLNKEYILAQKYNDVLSKTLFHKQWAKKYQEYINKPELMDQDPEFISIKPLMAYNDLLDNDSNLIELYILNNFAYMQGGTPELAELSLQCSLLLKNIELFWPRFFLYVKNHDRIPVHYQEAALLYDYLEGRVDISNIKFDPQIVARLENLIKLSQQYASQPEEYSKKIFKQSFGDTFWYYYFFVKDQKTME